MLRSVMVQGAEIAYRIKSPTQNTRPAALFIHAYMLDHTLWLDQLNGLSADRTCIAVDLPGHGASEPSPHKTVDVERDAGVLADFLAALNLGRKVHVVGMSAGGAVAAYLRLRAPTHVQTLSLLSTPFVQWATDAVKIYQREMARLVVTDGIDTVFRRFDEYIAGPNVDLHTRARYKAMLMKCRHETMVALLMGEALSARPDIPAKLDLPVLMPYGTHDVAMTPPVVEKMLAAFPNAKAQAIENGGRLLPIEAPVVLNQSLSSFWKANDGL